MSKPDRKKKSLKEKIFHEMAEYWTIFIYLALVFAVFTQYRRWVLAAHDITYTNYWVAVIEGLILSKVVMIGDVMRLGRRLDHKPLIYSTLLKTIVFSIFVWAFTLLEHAVKGLVTGKGIMGDLAEFLGKGHHELLAGTLVIFVALVPFFAFRELGRVFGKDKVWDVFFVRRTSEPSKSGRRAPKGGYGAGNRSD
jgi:hypothetical protein